jgi:hypothetical protein
MELTPKADGTMAETRFNVDVDRALRETGWVAGGGGGGAGAQPAATPGEGQFCGCGVFGCWGIVALARACPSDAGLTRAWVCDAAAESGAPAAGGAGGAAAGPDKKKGFTRSISMAELAAAEVVTAQQVEQEQPDDIP